MALYAFDGTWNAERDRGEYNKNTNVVKFRDAYTGGQRFYTKGVGTRLGWLGKIIGGAFGAGGGSRLKEASRDLFRFYKERDRDIDVIGFSRGAALALDFANRIHSEGVRDPDSGQVLEMNPPIRFLGLWDVVAAFGIPIDIGIEFQRINLGHQLTLPSNVKQCFHAIALDERRQAFRVTRVKRAYEVWFRGAHSDVGGGNDNPFRNNIALSWMLYKALAVGLPIDPAKIAAVDAEIDPNAPIRPASFDPIKNRFRDLASTDRIHHSVRPLADGNPVPAGSPSETVEDEKLKKRLA